MWGQYDEIRDIIKDSVEIQPALERYGIEFNRSGAALCPFHQEKTPSLKCKHDYWHCFGCGEGGDIIRFVMDYFQLDYINALKKINDDFGLGLIEECSGRHKQIDFSKRGELVRRAQMQKKAKSVYTDEYKAWCDIHRCFLWYLKHLHPDDSRYVEAAHCLPAVEYWFETHPLVPEDVQLITEEKQEEGGEDDSNMGYQDGRRRNTALRDRFFNRGGNDT